ncbi:LysR family transcriptional regulator [Qipengyuania qiaonensis]|uniref:LysR family transcriptional regulator n=1 Tax=Qipengyuania qiaonensis TaxID=2867240 RepID=A0ABS7J6H1_9SPHN|nr:LysR family transcriptional regulator [Qipengyuania qiaonensis]MBX7481669.1 LysR family transcriptional regulator [Qipengyuania qiaonensis]
MKQRFTVRHGALDGVEAFLAVARHRSFRQGADALGVTPSAISQAVRTLEERIGVALFIRTTRSVGLTEAGQRFFDGAAPAFADLVAASEAAQGLGLKPSGLLRIAAPRGVMPLIVEPVILSFCRAYPDVELEIAASEELVDLAEGGFDAGIRMGQFIDADMTAIRLSPPFPFIIVATPDYLGAAGTPHSPADLQSHACLRIRQSSGAVAGWRLVDDGKPIEVAVNGPLIANDFPTLLVAARGGLGLAQLPAPMAEADLATGKLQVVLSEYAMQTPGVFLYHPGRRQVLPKLRAFIDHITAAAI